MNLYVYLSFSYLNMPNLKFSIAFFHRNCRLHPLTWYFVFPVSPCPMCGSAEHLNVYCQPHIFCLFMHILCILYPTFLKKKHILYTFSPYAWHIFLAQWRRSLSQDDVPSSRKVFTGRCDGMEEDHHNGLIRLIWLIIMDLWWIITY